MRRVTHLVEHLPPDSAYARAEGVWGYTEELLANLIEVEDRGQLWWLSAHAKKGARLPKPIVIERPYRKRTKRKATSADLVKMFGDVAKYVPSPS